MYKFYYADNSEYEGNWKDAPGRGVQVIAWDGNIRHQGDFYREENSEPVAMDYDSMLHYVVEELCVVKVGYMLGSKKWNDVFQRAKADRDS